jgi:hypothetical protein
MIALGAVLALLSAAADALAVVSQASEAREVSRGHTHLRLLQKLIVRPRWLAGTGLMVLEWPLQVLALTWAPITVVQPMLATSQLFLLWLARLRLREHVGRREVVAVGLTVIGLVAVVWQAPRHTVADVSSVRVAVPIIVVGTGALIALALGRVERRAGLLLVTGAGLGYACADFSNKLLSNEASVGHWGIAALWLVPVMGFGVIGFVQETTALNERPASFVAPVIGGIKDPLPVLMAVAGGVEVWGSRPERIIALVAGLALVVAGTAILARSPLVTHVSMPNHPARVSDSEAPG